MRAGRQRNLRQVHVAVVDRARTGDCLSPVLVPGVDLRVGEQRGLAGDFSGQHVLVGGAVGVQDEYAARGLVRGELGEHSEHRRDPDSGRAQHHRCGIGQGGSLVQHEIAERERDLQGRADLRRGVQPAGDLAGGAAARGGVHAADGDPPRAVAGSRGQRVLAQLAGAVGQDHADGGVLASAEVGQVLAVGPAEGEDGDRVRDVLAGNDRGGAEHVARLDARLGVELLLEADKDAGHDPVDLVPGLGDRRGDGLSEYVDDRGEQVVVDDLVLVLGDAEARVLMPDAREQVDGALAVDEHRGEGGD